MYTIDRVFSRSRKTIKIPYPTAAHHLQIPLTFPMQEEPKEQSNLHQWIFYYVKWWNVIDSNDARLSANKLSMNIKLNELLNVILIPTVQNANATFAQQSFIPYTHTHTHTLDVKCLCVLYPSATSLNITFPIRAKLADILLGCKRLLIQKQWTQIGGTYSI